uniref:3-keto-disaccharide hydrolase n=1 Tax=uncultured Sphingomonas sp. TaxID=158754 RepID=UPI0035CAA0A6
MTKLMKHLMSPVALLATLTAVSTATAEGPPDGSTPAQKAIIAADPTFTPQRLVLSDLPKPVRPAIALFNGRDLRGWDTWLGAAEPITTYAPVRGKSIGLNHDDSHVFSVVTEDGAPAIFANGKIWGGLLTKGIYQNYHLHLQFKWGANKWTPFPRNNGVLYHSHGAYGAFFGSWMQAVEFEIVPHSVGMVLTVGSSRDGRSFDGVDWRVGAQVPVGHDATIPYPGRRYLEGGRVVPVAFPAYNVDAGKDAENAIGSWNTLDLYVVGDRAIHVVNGVPVMVVEKISTTDGPGGKRHALTRGRIQLQSEGAETYFRAVTLEPITRLPKITSAN